MSLYRLNNCMYIMLYLGGCGGYTTTTTHIFLLSVARYYIGGNFILIKFLWYVIFFINAFFFLCYVMLRFWIY